MPISPAIVKTLSGLLSEETQNLVTQDDLKLEVIN